MSQPERILFRNIRVIDGSGTAPFMGEVLVAGRRIEAVGRQAGALDAQGATVVEGGGATLMPGLVEAHAHASFANTSTLEALGDIPPEEHTLLTMKHVRLLLDHGFTSISSAASAKPRLDVVIRNAIEAGDIPGPRMLAASPEITPTSGLGDVRLHHMHRDTFAVVADGADEFRRVARHFVREGVDTLKINPSGDEFVPHARARHTVMNDDEVAAVCEVARSRDKRVAAHARSAESVKMALRHGVQIIFHATLSDEEALDQLEAARDRVFVVPTVGVTYATFKEAGDFGIHLPGDVLDALEVELEAACANMKALHRRGVRILPGGDYGFLWNPIGRNARDLEHFVKLFGFSPLEAITAATRLGGELMMQGDELGQVKPGFLADLLLVDGDPSRDVAILQDRDRLLAIMQEGRFHKAPAAGRRVAQPMAAE
ncbi:imidazolonepropionase-like amidohydrolase [Stella humosa]|uniref:Imidazolonepropionase-like amidohydrolase n=1 Tax=Stella humosa TaxID=94 RepID=A0A3N1MCE4_9PROT|nr:amidohydrolase family protein [Stella humosa]ROQ01268.1 imidazolonepropionase-like amidohydrolase [Stella humosa]BBK31642.1 dipeptidase [Stella humosa]